MKTFIISMVLLFCQAVITGWANNLQGEIVSLTVQIDNNQTGGNNIPKTPILAPLVSIDGYTLYFLSSHSSFTLELRDASDTVVYTTYIDVTDTQVSLPTTLTGTYELRLCTEYYYFYGDIDL